MEDFEVEGTNKEVTHFAFSKLWSNTFSRGSETIEMA